jgi:two-component system sensor histidine kinase UhpB
VVQYVIGTGIDISKRKQMEESLKTHGRVLENMAEGVLVADEDNIIYFTNPAFDAMFGYERSELSGQNASILNLDPARTAALFATEIDQALQSTGVWSGEFKNRKKDGSSFITTAHVSRLEIPDKTFLISVQEDITLRKQMEAEKDRLLNEISEQRKQLRALTQQLSEAEEVERKQLAQELHDQVGSNLTALGLNLNILQKQIPDSIPDADLIKARLKDTQEITEQTTERIRNVMANLHPPVLDDYGLGTALNWYAKQLAPRVNFAITVQSEEPDPRLSISTEYALFRIAQEALNNVAKHAQASQATITLKTDPQTAQLVIADDGRGFDTARVLGNIDRPGWGLLTMIERAERIGGHCCINSTPKQGTQIKVEIPR